jgi:hypothetical protein
LQVSGTPARGWTVTLGQEIDITLGTLGPGQYVSPPTIAGAAVSFIDMTYPAPQYPSGTTQLFRFRAAQAGQVLITFHSAPPSAQYPDVVDTVTVR